MKEKTFETKPEILSEKNYLSKESKLKESKNYLIELVKKVGVIDLGLAGIVGIFSNGCVAHAEVAQVMKGTLLVSFIEKTQPLQNPQTQSSSPSLFKPLRKHIIEIAIVVTVISLVFKIIQCINDENLEMILPIVGGHIFALLVLGYSPTLINNFGEFLEKNYF